MNKRETEIAADIRALFGEDDQEAVTIDFPTLPAGRIEIKWSRMYEAPTLGYETLRKIAEHFGTEKVDVDDHSQGGCETCDYGSSYGHIISIDEATKNAHEQLA